MTHKTNGIVLRTVKYGETSLVVSVLTERFGLQSYMVNGVRVATKRGIKAILYQPGALLDLEVYHNDKNTLQRIKEARWHYVPEYYLTLVSKHCILLFWIEIILRSIKEPEPNSDLFCFLEDMLVQLDQSDRKTDASINLFFLLQWAQFFGLRIHQPEISHEELEDYFLDLKEVCFVEKKPTHNDYLSGINAATTAELLKVMQPSELQEIEIPLSVRRELLKAYLRYYEMHFPDFGQIRSLPILQEVLGG